MFEISASGRDNLQDVLIEFERAARCYPPLYHQRLFPWSRTGSKQINSNQWKAFIDSQSEVSTKHEWYKWDGPWLMYLDTDFFNLGRWFGNPEGLDEFENLVESLQMIIGREDYAIESSHLAPFAFVSLNGWMRQLHSWAFRFQMPLLRCETQIWGAEDVVPDAFYETVDKWNSDGNESFPMHPVCWQLTDNVFTSTMTAIRSLLKSESVISSNETWLMGDELFMADQPKEIFRSAESSPKANILRQNPLAGWEIIPSDNEPMVFSKFQAGLSRLAAIIESDGKETRLEDLVKKGARPVRKKGGLKTSQEESFDHGFTHGSSPHSNQMVDVLEEPEATLRLLEWLNVEKAKAEKSGDDSKIRKLNQQIEGINDSFQVSENGILGRKGFLRNKDRKNTRDTVVKTIKQAVDHVFAQSPELGEELRIQIDYKKLVFNADDNFQKWIVERQR